MTATGIIRRMDDLGRVVIPREVRRKLGLKEGDELEIFIDHGGVCFVPYHRDLSDELEALRIKIINDYKLTKRDGVINDLFNQISDLMEE